MRSSLHTLYVNPATTAFILTCIVLWCVSDVYCQGEISLSSSSSNSSGGSSSSSSSGSAVIGLLHGHDSNSEQDKAFSSDKEKQKDKDKGEDVKGGFPGGKPPVGRRCPEIRGCRICPGGVCTACYYNYGGSRFQLRDGLCRCPPGFGAISGLNMPTSPYVTLASESASDSKSKSKSEDNTPRPAEDNADNSHYDNSNDGTYNTGSIASSGSSDSSRRIPTSSGSWFFELPAWAYACKPCPGGSFSVGGDIWAAECQVCEQGYTSLPASAGCTIRTDCTIGQQPNDRGNCVPCRIGAYQDTPSTGVCKPCPRGFTTVSRGSTSINDCKVPVCPGGQQLQTFNTGPNVDVAYWCANCTGLGISKGGRVWQGADQPKCQDCALPKVPTLDRTSCAANICPPPDTFRINCTAATAAARKCPGTTVNPRVVFLPSLCTASPQGAVLSWYKATSCTAGVCAYNFNAPLAPPLANCPVTGVVNGTDPYAPFITSFNGRTDCLCPVGQINCNFVTGLNTQTNFKPFTTATTANTVIITN